MNIVLCSYLSACSAVRSCKLEMHKTFAFFYQEGSVFIKKGEKRLVCQSHCKTSLSQNPHGKPRWKRAQKQSTMAEIMVCVLQEAVEAKHRPHIKSMFTLQMGKKHLHQPSCIPLNRRMLLLQKLNVEFEEALYCKYVLLTVIVG